MDTILYSTLKPNLLKTALFKGSMMGAFGVFAMIAASQFVTLNELIFLGPLVAIASFFLIAYGFKPYRVLKNLESHPLELRVNYEGITFHGTLFPKSDIEKIEYIEEGSHYGIRLTLKHKLPVESSEEEEEVGDKVFFPYFSEKSAETLKNAFNTDTTDP